MHTLGVRALKNLKLRKVVSSISFHHIPKFDVYYFIWANSFFLNVLSFRFQRWRRTFIVSREFLPVRHYDPKFAVNCAMVLRGFLFRWPEKWAALRCILICPVCSLLIFICPEQQMPVFKLSHRKSFEKEYFDIRLFGCERAFADMPLLTISITAAVVLHIDHTSGSPSLSNHHFSNLSADFCAFRLPFMYKMRFFEVFWSLKEANFTEHLGPTDISIQIENKIPFQIQYILFSDFNDFYFWQNTI